jgi:hypothetical protein
VTLRSGCANQPGSVTQAADEYKPTQLAHDAEAKALRDAAVSALTGFVPPTCHCGLTAYLYEGKEHAGRKFYRCGLPSGHRDACNFQDWLTNSGDQTGRRFDSTAYEVDEYERYRIEPAPTARARCTVCKGPIGRGAIKFILTLGHEGRPHNNRHLRCCSADLAASAIVHGNPTGCAFSASSVDGVAALSPALQAQVKEALEAIVSRTPLSPLLRDLVEFIAPVSSKAAIAATRSGHQPGSAEASTLASNMVVLDDTDLEAPVKLEEPELFCSCRKEDDGSPMICCDNAACAIAWYHLACVGKKAALQGSWYCISCKAAKKLAKGVKRKR